MPAIHPLQGAFLAGTVPLFLGALISDLAYVLNYQIQWSNFAAWLLAGAMVFTGISLLWSLVPLLRQPSRRGWPLTLFGLMLVAFLLGLIDCFVHARDAWGVMPDGLILTFIVTVLVIAATWIGFSNLRGGAAS